MTRRNPTVAACVETVATWWPSTKICADPCVGPTVVIQGDKDASAPLDITGRRVAAGIRGAELKVYAGAPHGLFVTHMDGVNRDLEAFLRT